MPIRIRAHKVNRQVDSFRNRLNYQEIRYTLLGVRDLKTGLEAIEDKEFFRT